MFWTALPSCFNLSTVNIIPVLRQHQQRPLLLWVLCFLFLSQSLTLPFLSQLKPAQDASGKWVMVCTLQGLKPANVGINDVTQQVKTSHNCPACTLSSSIDTASIVVPLLLHVVMQERDEITANRVIPSAYQLIPAFHIRAPPLA